MKFWDSSAVVPLCIAEPWTEPLKALLGADRAMMVWWGTPVECGSALARPWRDEGDPPDVSQRAQARIEALGRDWITVAASEEVRQLALRLVRVHPLRAGDAFQLSAALVWAEGRPRGRDFVTVDDRLRGAARLEGFTVVPEGGGGGGTAGRLDLPDDC